MKRPASRFRQILSLFLCCLLTAACLAVPASSAEQPGTTPAPVVDTDTTDPGQDPAGPDIDDTAPDTPDTAPTPDGSPAPEEPDEPGTEPDGTQEPEPTDAPENPDEPEEMPAPEKPKTVTVRFVLHKGDELELKMLPDQTVPASEVPTGEGEELTLIGWTDEAGEPVDLAETVITEDRVFTAQWAKRIAGLFDLESHRAYVAGKSEFFFKPNDSMTRAEAAAMFYSLLKNQKCDDIVERFIDVPDDAWYFTAVRKTYSLGIISGYHDGTFQPNKAITRAEFITIASACDELETGECPFPDLDDAKWARDNVISAYQKGWIAGDSKGNFNPNKKLTRAEAVTILNNILGRTPEANVKAKAGVKNFCDVFTDYWAYGQIVEASTTHGYEKLANGGEKWTDYVKDTSTPRKGWVQIGKTRYYVGADGKCVRGEQTVNGKSCLFDNNGAAVTGFRMKGGWKRYYLDGVMQEDISGLGVVKGPYYIKVYKPANYLIIFAKGDDGKYNIPVRSMITSCGEPTPTGTYYTPAKFRWCEMVGGSWAQWCTQISGPYLFHSVPNDVRNNTTMWVNEYNLLGTTRSLGCIRLTCEDAKWVYDNCELGTTVYISPTETSGPMKKPTSIKLQAGHSWDPTDPTAYYLCQQRGCH